MLRKLAFILAVAAGTTLPFASPAPAAIADGALAGRTSLIDNALIERVQYAYGGQNYCYSDTGWKGPGWYWCGNEQTYGVGWGGAYGWRGWTYAGRGVSASDATAAPGSVITAPSVGATAAPGSAATGGGGAGGRYGGGARGGYGGGGARVGHHGGGRGGGGGGGGGRASLRRAAQA